MMHKRKNLYRGGIILLTALSILVCPLASGIYSAGSAAFAQGPLPTLPPSNVTVTPAMGTAIAQPTPVPTLGPGQYFEEGDDLPQVTRTDLLDEIFGYSEILGETGLYLVWSTDNDGKRRYYIVDEGNEYFEEIKAVFDADQEDKRELEELDVEGDAQRHFGETLFLGFGTLLCGAGTVTSLFLTPVSAPITGVLSGCTYGLGTLTKASWDEMNEDLSAIQGYDNIHEERRNEVEGYFVQIPFSLED